MPGNAGIRSDMFTGIIEAVRPVKAVRQVSGKTNITIARPDNFDDIKDGSSIALNGICLTVIELSKETFTVEIMNETVQKTTAGKWVSGSMLNLERAIKIGGRLDGHWVQGHVDTTSALLETRTINSTLYLTFALPAKDKDLFVPQGSIAINGVSLTISELKSDRFTVALIGHTITNTNLSKLTIGSKVNLEYDILGKYLLRKNETKEINKEYLDEQGF
jgi:riboflavin synthase